MHELIDAFIQVMGHSERLYRELGGLLEQEPQLIVGREIERLANATAEKQRLLSRQAALVEQQGRLWNQITRHYNLPSMANLKQIAEQLPASYAQELTLAGQRLRESMLHVQRLNRQSRLLVQHCLKMVQNALVFLTSRSAPLPLYAASGSIGTGSSGGRLVSSTV